jgi:arylsulfatase A-like enzyme
VNDTPHDSHRRRLLKGLGAAATTLLPFAGAAAPAIIKRRKPNILLIVSDQQRDWQDLPSQLDLPARDWLAQRGTLLHQFQAHTTPCSPSRSTLYTGQHTQFTRMTANHGAPPFQELAPLPTLGHLLREQGYYTAYKGKWHLSHVADAANLVYGTYPSTRHALEPFGFADYNDDGDPHGVTWTGYKFDGQIAAQSAQWLFERGARLDQPWCLAVNFVNPHDIMYYDDVDRRQSKTRLDPDYLSPLSPPPRAGLYAKDWDLPLPATWNERADHKVWAQRSYIDFCDKVYGLVQRRDEAAWRRYQSYYFNCVRDADRNAMTVLQALADSGQDRETVVIFTADHGEMAGAHGLRQKGPHAYKENIRVPCAMVHPDASGGRTSEALGGMLDLVPTMLAVAGVDDRQRRERYPQLKGVDLLPLAAASTARTERDRRGHLYDYNTTLYVDPEFAIGLIRSGYGGTRLGMLRQSIASGQLGPRLDNPGLFRGVFDGRYKFVRYFRPAQHHIPRDWETLLKYNELELYDTELDPDERTNLALQPETQRALIERLNAQTNALIEAEIGFDDGREHPGPGFMYRL